MTKESGTFFNEFFSGTVDIQYTWAKNNPKCTSSQGLRNLFEVFAYWNRQNNRNECNFPTILSVNFAVSYAFSKVLEDWYRGQISSDLIL